LSSRRSNWNSTLTSPTLRPWRTAFDAVPLDLGSGTRTRMKEGNMKRICQHALAFLNEEDGPSAVEYAIMMALIIVACMATLITLGTKNNNTYSYVGQKVGRTAGS
jgi:pilus assembly protein Flp/PilA